MNPTVTEPTATKLLPDSWETERLRISSSRLEETSRLNALYNACCETVGAWDDSFTMETEEGTRELIGKSIAGFVDRDATFAMRTIRLRESDAIVGYFHVYHGLPKPEVIFLSMCAIDPAYQKQGIGSELTDSLTEQARLLGSYEAIWARVALKNWPALRHWMAMGFRTMLEWRGDTVHSPTTWASLIVEKRIA